MTVDDNALIRHPALAALRAATQLEEGDPEALAADRHHLNYQRMDGDIGVCVNGAGLSLATLDMIVENGGRPANFMDIRTTASSLDVAYGFDLILANPKVRAVLLNVHGGACGVRHHRRRCGYCAATERTARPDRRAPCRQQRRFRPRAA